MAEQPDITVTDAGASPAGMVTVKVDGHETIATPAEAKVIIADAVSDAQ